MHTTKPLSTIVDYNDFKESFIEPTWKEYLHFKYIKSFPTISEAQHWAKVFGDPMTETEYQTHKELIGEEEAEKMLKIKALNASGWYMTDWFRYITRFFSFNLKAYRDQIFDNECTMWFDLREDMKRDNYSRYWD